MLAAAVLARLSGLHMQCVDETENLAVGTDWTHTLPGHVSPPG
jgi:hypothetical protein